MHIPGEMSGRQVLTSLVYIKSVITGLQGLTGLKHYFDVNSGYFRD